MRYRKATAGEPSRPGTGTICLIWLAGILYAALGMHHWLYQPVHHGLVFNEMLRNLLHGRFDISPDNIGEEAFVYQGRTYAYFGIFCAFLRSPLLLAGYDGVDMTGASLLIAAATSMACRLAIATAILNRAPTVPPLLRWAVLIAMVTNGEAIQYLIPSIFQEVVSWGHALASIFVLIAVRLVLGFTRRSAATYAGLAVVAGLALLCRVTFGLGLYAALGLMGAVEILQSLNIRGGLISSIRKLAPAGVILALLTFAVAGVNYERWGNPVTFIPLQYQAVQDRENPDRLIRLERYGSVNIRRIPFSFQYYFAPVWAITDQSGKFLFEAQQVDLYDAVELPPGSFFLSDTLLCVLAAIGACTLAFKPRQLAEPALARAALIGLMLPAGMMLMVASLAFRYRMEFYMALDFSAFIGLANLTWRETPLPAYVARTFAALSAWGMGMAVIGLVSYALLAGGPATIFDFSRGWITLMENKVAGRNIYRPGGPSAHNPVPRQDPRN